MNERSWKIFYLLMLLGTVLPLIFDYRISCGFLLGSIEALIHYKRLEHFWNGVIDTKVSHASTGLGHFALTFLMMAGVLLLCAFVQDIFNIYACAVGMILVKIATYVDLFVKKGGKNDDTK